MDPILGMNERVVEAGVVVDMAMERKIGGFETQIWT